MSAEIQSVHDQRQEIAATRTFEGYRGLVMRHFQQSPSTGEWVRNVHSFTQQNPDLDANPDFWGLSAFDAMVCARNGFPSLRGQESRHSRMGWTDSPYTPLHQIANTIYVADLTTKIVDPFKNKLSQRLSDESLRPGVQGMFIRTIDGRILKEDDYLSKVEQFAIERLAMTYPICEPDRELDSELSTIPFDGNDVEDTTSRGVELFRTTVLPRLQHVTRDLFNAGAIFEHPRA
jgi:hypothetical protein